MIMATALFFGVSQAFAEGIPSGTPGTLILRGSRQSEKTVTRTIPLSSKQASAAMKNSGTVSLKQSKTAGKKSKGVKGFGKDPFSLEYRRASRNHAAKLTTGAKDGLAEERTASQAAQGGKKQSRVSFSGNNATPTDDRLQPQRSAFSGGPETLPHMDTKAPPELSLTYKMSNRAATRVTLNQQNADSPLYRPVEKHDGVNSAGVYMDVDVKENLQVQIGGEYRDLDDSRHTVEENARGASVGLRWNF